MQSTATDSTSNLTSFDGWLRSLGRTRCTGYRWRKLGLVKTENIFGKLYISREEIARFEQRAASGEFARDLRNPRQAA